MIRAFQKSLISGIAECRDCEWRSEDFINVQRRARVHHHKTGHAISMELVYAAKYKRRPAK